MARNRRGGLSGEWWQRLLSFKYAFNGICCAVKTERNLQIHLAASVLVILAAACLRLGIGEWRWLLLAMVLVWSAELLNTAIEAVCDVVSRDFHPGIKVAKDIAAGAALVCACGAMLIGVTIFLPLLSA